jgi:hypothetical protein
MAATSVSSGTTSAKFLDAHSARRGLIITNDDANRLYVLCGSGAASSTNYSFSLAQNENAAVYDYTGEVNGIWAADGSGAAKITEY